MENETSKSLSQLEEHLKEELRFTEEYRKDLASLLQSVKILRGVKAIPSEGETVSYKLGKTLLDTKGFLTIVSLPKRLWSVYKYAQYRKKLKEQSRTDKYSVKENNNHSVTIKENQPQVPKNKSVQKEFKNFHLSKGLTLLDPISELCWSDAFTGFPLARHNFEEQIRISTGQFAFFESAWRANHSKWLYAFTSPGLKHANAQALLKAIALLKERNMPIIFWNKEDPMHYEMFKPIAKYVDYIFTTDDTIVGKYKIELNTQRVWALPFAAPVRKTNPLNRFNNETGTICFAGTYYAKNHENRKKQMDMILPVLLEHQGCIYDRASNEKKDEYSYPSIYSTLLRDGVGFEEMIKIYKKFKIFLNVNTITQSSTMMSRRVYELLASGTPVVSTPSKAISEQFPGIVITVRTKEEASIAVKKLLSDSYYWHKTSMMGIREVLSKHTYQQRWQYIQQVVEGKIPDVPSIPKVKVVSIYHGYVPLEFHLNSFAYQENINISEVILLVSEKSSLFKGVKSIKNENFRVKIESLASFKKSSIGDEAQYTVITSDKYHNFRYSFWGLLLAFKYSDAKAIVRSPYYKYSTLQKNSFDFSVKNANWYALMKESELTTIVVRNDKLHGINIDFNRKIIRSPEGEKALLLVDPFNMVYLDDPTLTKENTAELVPFVYRVSPFLGV